MSCPFFGFTANCTFEPPVSTPTSRIMAIAPSRMRWYSLSVNVMIGATVIESPVCTPIASIFSIPQTTTQLSFLSRTTSSSYSFQPSADSSINTWLIREASIPLRTIVSNSSLLYAMPPPVPPSVNAGRIIAGKPISSRNANASSIVETVLDFACSKPARSTISRNASRSSARKIISLVAPIISTSNSVSVPSSSSSHAQFNAV